MMKVTQRRYGVAQEAVVIPHAQCGKGLSKCPPFANSIKREGGMHASLRHKGNQCKKERGQPRGYLAFVREGGKQILEITTAKGEFKLFSTSVKSGRIRGDAGEAKFYKIKTNTLKGSRMKRTCNSKAQMDSRAAHTAFAIVGERCRDQCDNSGVRMLLSASCRPTKNLVEQFKIKLAVPAGCQGKQGGS